MYVECLGIAMTESKQELLGGTLDMLIVSRFKIGYKIFDRHQERGGQRLTDLSRRPYERRSICLEARS